MSELQALLRVCTDEQSWLVSTIEAFARAESPSSDKAAVDAYGALVDATLRELGWRTERLAQPRAGDHLRAEKGEGATQVLLLGHLDTVWPVGQLDRMPVRVEAGRLHGPGVFDMKAGTALALLAVKALDVVHAALPQRVVLLLSSDDEVGSTTSRALIEAEAARSAAVLVLEPALPGGGVKTSRKGVGEFLLEFEGIAAHAGIEPERGASAIVELARQIETLAELQDLPRGITVNVGRVEGGTRSNVVAAHARAEVDVRVQTLADADRIAQAFADLRPSVPGVTLRVSGGMNRPPMERTPGVLRLYARARAIAAELGHDLAEGGTGGGSDGNFTAALGVPTLDGLGAVGAGAHALDEHVELEPLAWRAALLAGMLLRLR